MRHGVWVRAARGLFGAALGVLVVLLIGCGKRGWLETYPVKGTVLVDGKLAKGATVSFHPKEAVGDKPYLPTGQTNEAASSRFHIRRDDAPRRANAT